MKILIFNTLYYPQKLGGAEVSIQLLAETLVKMGHEVKVVSLINDMNISNSNVNGVHCAYYPIPNIYWPFGNVRENVIKKAVWHFLDCFNIKSYFIAINEIKVFNPDIVHTNNLAGWSISVWSAAKRYNKKIVHTTRDYYLIHPNSTLFKRGGIVDDGSFLVNFINFPKKLASRNVDVFVGISDFIRDIHLKNNFFIKAKNETIYNSVTPVVKHKLIHKSDTCKRRIGFIGRLTKEKGFDVFCNMAKSLKDNDKYEFIAAGDFMGESSEIYINAKENGVELLGYIPPAVFLEMTDIVILPIKWNEPFGRVVVECVLSGKIVISTPVGGITELSRILPNIYLTDKIEKEFTNFLDMDAIPVVEMDMGVFDENHIASKYINAYFS
ncbi:glycosyltransferase family 4 protein [Pectobacterium carotovorum]|uniref:glycosyltransferase family 4 protein n=1 Tax=Pectobacterium carotovorum TaxID=554 RepID=UPI001E411BC0|nr:glycosyltransferase family 4 protein [Pectobacterium carotovorum]UFT95769.1 glycosyltransferase family 4 protein [Pectobacterium carotovorum]